MTCVPATRILTGRLAGARNICSFWIRKRRGSAAARARLPLKSARGGLNRAAWLSVNMSCGIMDRRPICCAKLLRSLHMRIQSSPSTGKSFDLPLLESRMIMNRIRAHVTDMPHLDLLHAARRVYKLRRPMQPDCAGGSRSWQSHDCDDLPGAQVPERYFTYLKTGEFALLEDVLSAQLRRRAQSLAELTAVICSAYRQAGSRFGTSRMILSVGKTLLRGGRTQQARGMLQNSRAQHACAHRRICIWRRATSSGREWDGGRRALEGP